MLADVRERLLDRAEDRDPLGRGERLGVAADLELRVDPGALRERVDLAVEDLAERSGDDAPRLERARELSQLAVELGDAREHVVEAARSALAVALQDERVDLVAQERDLGAERQDVLDRPVVEVEAEPHQPLLAGPDERLLTLGRALEQELALEDRGERRRRRREVGVGAADRLEHARDDAAHGGRKRRTSAARSVFGPRRLSVEPRRSAAFAVARARRLSAPSPRASITSTLPPSARQSDASVATPSWRRSRSWISQATSGGSSSSERARAARAVEVEARGLERLAAHLRERLDRDLHVGRVELALGGERDDDACDVDLDREPVGGVGLARRPRTRRAPSGARCGGRGGRAARASASSVPVRSLERAAPAPARRRRPRRPSPAAPAVPPCVFTRDAISPRSPIVS